MRNAMNIYKRKDGRFEGRIPLGYDNNGKIKYKYLYAKSLAEIKEKMLYDGALGAQMSGSGPAVFGLFDDYMKAKNSADGFLGKYKDVYVTRFYG